jgi:hypothetical protein
VFMSLSRTHCRNAGISAEMLCSPVLKYFLRNSSPSKPASDQPNHNPSDEPHLRLLLILVDILVKRELSIDLPPAPKCTLASRILQCSGPVSSGKCRNVATLSQVLAR